MENVRVYTETVQVRTHAIKSNGVGKEWIPRIEKHYEFHSVDEFIRTFQPTTISEGLMDAIKSAYNNCSSVTFNAGNGNKTFNFKTK